MRGWLSAGLVALVCAVAPASAAAQAPAGQISGTVTASGGAALEGVCATADPVGAGSGAFDFTDAAGNYTITGLAPGDYKVRFEPCSAGNFAPEYYDNAATFAAAQTVTVTSGQTTGSINGQLDVGATVTGTVEGPGNAALDNVCVTAAPTGAGFTPEGVRTNSSGQYTIIGLRAGSYRVRFDPCDTDLNLLPEWYDDAAAVEDADPVVLTGGQTASGINADLVAGAAITGTVRDSDGNPLENACVRAFRVGGSATALTFTGETGTYRLRRIPAGAYKIEFDPCGVNGDEPEFYDNEANLASADAVNAPVDSEVTGIDAQLARDTVPPLVTITAGPSGPTSDDRPEFEFAAEPGATVECSVDQGVPEYGPCSDADAGLHAPGVLADGSYTFRVRATDEAGNPSVATRSFIVDTQRPSLAITAGPDGTTNDTTPTFEFATEQGATVECSIDSGATAFGACSGAGTHTPGAPLADGSYAFRVRSTDAAGNRSTATRTFSVDSVGPAITITSGPSGLTNDTTPTFGFDASDGATVQCSIDNGTPEFGPCSGPASHTPAAALADGSYTFRVRASDGISFNTATRTFVLDSAAPQLSITSGPTGTTQNNRPTFTFSSEAGAEVECSIDSGAASFGPCTSETTHTPGSNLADGAYNFRVRSTDAAGNTAIQTRSFAIDTQAPAVAIVTGPNGETTDDTPSFGFTAEPGASVVCSIDTGIPSFVPCSEPTGHTAQSLSPGAYSFRVRATDAAGLESTATRNFTVVSPPDQTAPSVSITSGPKGKIKDKTPSFAFEADDPGASFLCSVDGKSAKPCTSPTTLKKLKGGRHTFAVIARDAAGNESAAAKRSFKLPKKKKRRGK